MTLSSSTIEEAQQEEIVEEDWSSYFHSNNNEDDFTNTHTANNSLLTGFSQHYEVTIPISTSSHQQEQDQDQIQIPIMLKLKCVESLTPLDMINLSNGDNDSTGHRIWMGALFFIECFACPLPPLPSSSSSSLVEENEQEKIKMIQLLKHWRKILFHQKHILELGAGTGASGISLMVSSLYHHCYHHHHYHYQATTTCHDNDDDVINNKSNQSNNTQNIPPTTVTPKSITFTDLDPTVLDLCHKNIESNYDPVLHNYNKNPGVDDEEVLLHDASIITYNVFKLEWGSNAVQQMMSNHHNSNYSINHSPQPSPQPISTNDDNKNVILYDTIIATDVIYDTDAIQPLFETSSSLIQRNGYFVLSHIPRASIDSSSTTYSFKSSSSSSFSIKDEIEKLIVQTAKSFGFVQIHFSSSSLECNNDEANNDNDNNNVDDTIEDDYCLRPRHLIKLQRQIITSNKDISSYDDMESIGAGVLIFQKK